MAWVAVADFNALTTADLAGQAGGTGWTGNWVNGAVAAMNVTAAQAWEGAKSVDINDAVSNTFYYRELASAVTGDGNIVYFALRRSLNNSGECSGGLRSNTAPGNSRVSVGLKANGNLELGGTSTVTLLTGYAVNTWYVIRLTFNVDAGTATAAYSTNTFGGTLTFSAESSAVTMASSGDITRFQIQADANAGTDFLDLITGTNPSVSIALSDTAGAPSETLVIGQNIVLSDTSGVPVDSTSLRIGFGNQTKNLSSWTNQPQS